MLDAIADLTRAGLLATSKSPGKATAYRILRNAPERPSRGKGSKAFQDEGRTVPTFLDVPLPGGPFSLDLGAASEPESLGDAARPFGRGVEAEGCGTGILDVPAALRMLERRLAGDGDASREREPAGRTEAHAMGPSP